MSIVIYVFVRIDIYFKKINNSIEDDFMAIANEIKQYFEDHPNASDTLEGITKWWPLRQRFEVSTLLAKQALDYLITQSIVVRKSNLSGDEVYFRAKPKCTDEK